MFQINVVATKYNPMMITIRYQKLLTRRYNAVGKSPSIPDTAVMIFDRIFIYFLFSVGVSDWIRTNLARHSVYAGVDLLQISISAADTLIISYKFPVVANETGFVNPSVH